MLSLLFFVALAGAEDPEVDVTVPPSSSPTRLGEGPRCYDNPSWNRAGMSGSDGNCAWVALDPGGRCHYVSGGRNGRSAERACTCACADLTPTASPVPAPTPFTPPAPTRRPTPHPSPRPTRRPTPRPTTATPTWTRPCADDADWHKRKAPSKGCGWASGNRDRRCHQQDAGGVSGYDACGCGCSDRFPFYARGWDADERPTPAPSADCADDSSWMKRGNKPDDADCDWVAKKPATRCGKVDRDDVKAADACACACRDYNVYGAVQETVVSGLAMRISVETTALDTFILQFNADGATKVAVGAGTMGCLPGARAVSGVVASDCDLGNGACLDYSVVVHAETGAGESAEADARSTTRDALIACAASGALAANVAAALAHYNATKVFEVRGDATAAALATSDLRSDSADVVFDDQATCAEEPYDPYCELDSCEDAYVSDPETVREVSKWVPMGQGRMPGAKAYERYGGAVALSSNGATLVAGGPSESRSGARDPGVVRIYDYGLGCCSEGKAWGETLGASDVAAFVDDDGDEVPFGAEDKLGAAVAVSRDGKIVAVSAPGYGGGAGLVLVLRWRERDRAWVQTGNALVGDASAANADFGGAIDLNDDGDVLVVGARGDDAPDGTLAAGSVRAYKAQHGGWFPLGYPVYGDGPGDGLGWDVALSADGTTFVTSGPNANVYIDGDLNQDAGVVRVFQLAPNRYVGGWRQRGDDLFVEEAGTGQFAEAASAEFGYSVSISGDSNRIAIGSPGLRADNGKVRVYEWRNPTGNKWNWKRLGLDIRGACGGKGVYGDECVHQRMGEAVKLSRSGINLLVGSPAANAEANCTHPAPFAGCPWCDRCSPDHADYDGTYGETNVGLVRAYRYNATLGADGDALGWVVNGIAMFGDSKSGHFGSHIDMTDNANVAVVGSPHAMVPGVGTSAGSISVFRDEHSCYDAERNWVCDQNCDTSC